MTWRSLADILDVGPDPSDPVEAAEDWALLDELATAVFRFGRKAPARTRAQPRRGMLFCKQTAPEQSIHFRSLIWPQTRTTTVQGTKITGRPP